MELAKGVKVADLNGAPSDSFLYCYQCCARFSANYADYFNKPDNEIFKCCGEPMVLATSHTTIKVIKE